MGRWCGFCSDEHVTFSPPPGGSLPAVGDRVRVIPAHVDPTMAYHERLYLVSDEPGGGGVAGGPAGLVKTGRSQIGLVIISRLVVNLWRAPGG